MLLVFALLPACAPAPPLLRSVHQILPDGTSRKLADPDLTPFQALVRMRTDPKQSPKVDDLFLEEILVPEGEGHEGCFVAVVRTGKTTELRYFEQIDGMPRADRYFHRTLTPEESADFAAFIKAHPLATLTKRAQSGAAVAVMEPTSTQEAGGVGELPAMYRLTHAQRKAFGEDTQAILINAPVAGEYPADALVSLLAKLRDGGGAAPLTCTYTQSIPTTARLLYADPFRRVLQVWSQGEELRAAISPPVRPLQAVLPAEEEVEWMAYRDGKWSPSVPPPPPTTAPATAPATQLAGANVAQSPGLPSGARPPAATSAVVPQNVQSAPATAAASVSATMPVAAIPVLPPAEPSRFSNPDVLPKEEVWTIEPLPHATVVAHYMPLGEQQGIWKQFVVPSLMFDEEHASLDVAADGGATIYLIHDGQLFALPIPPAAMSSR